MVFSSVIFLHYFLPLAVLAGVGSQWLLGTRVANGVLLALSVLFYAWGLGADFVWLLAVSVAVNFALAIAAEAARDRGRDSEIRAVQIATIAFNISLLGYFKYANFFVAQTVGLRDAIGLPPLMWEHVALPIGISFFTFHALSYVFDVASGRCNALRNPVDLALYICFFPQLIAGPIIRYHAIDTQIARRTITVEDLGEGAVRFVHGLVKKVILADPAGAIADTCFSASAGDMTSAVAWLGAVAYTIQIYFDFSGYSDMAIGLARMFGFRFPENFDRPYASLSITEFWRRWHITLSAWFRDYVYIPLGGSRGGPVRTYANLITVFALTGLWHGANWTFVVWGLYHGGLLIIERVSGLRYVDEAERVSLSRSAIALRRAMTMLLVVIGWVIFRSDSMAAAARVLQPMFVIDFQGIPELVAYKLAPDNLLLLAVGVGLCLLPADFKGREAYHAARKNVQVAAIAGLLIIALPAALIRVASQSFSPFLYFQF
ncbi:MAG: MBOAT family protein [Hyphomicrobium sp.]|nr:MBOAT family protein [Hyphomicrobium sp.]